MPCHALPSGFILDRERAPAAILAREGFGRRQEAGREDMGFTKNITKSTCYLSN